MTKVYDKIVGNCRGEQWRQLLSEVNTSVVTLDR